MINKIKNKPLLIVAAGFISLAIIWGIYSVLTSEKAEYSQNRKIRYSFTLQNATNKLIEQAKFWAFGPVQQTSFQLTKDINASHPFELKRDEHGNNILYFTIKNLPPYGTKIITVTADIALSAIPHELALNNPQQYLAEEKYIERNSPAITKLATTLSKQPDSQPVEAIYKWVSANIKYAGYVKDDRGALYALKNRKGDCTEYMYLYTALMRAQKMPSRGIGGYVTGEDTILKAKDFHNWAETHINGTWRIIDPQNKRYMKNENHYIAMRIMSNKNNTLLENTHRFSYVGEGLIVRMN